MLSSCDAQEMTHTHTPRSSRVFPDAKSGSTPRSRAPARNVRCAQVKGWLKKIGPGAPSCMTVAAGATNLQRSMVFVLPRDTGEGLSDKVDIDGQGHIQSPCLELLRRAFGISWQFKALHSCYE
jgi:hypothetical protein